MYPTNFNIEEMIGKKNEENNSCIERNEEKMQKLEKSINFFIINSRVKEINAIYEIMKNMPSEITEEKYDELLAYLEFSSQRCKYNFQIVQKIIQSLKNQSLRNEEYDKILKEFSSNPANPTGWINTFIKPLEKNELKNSSSQTDNVPKNEISIQTDCLNEVSNCTSVRTYAEVVKKNIETINKPKSKKLSSVKKQTKPESENKNIKMASSY